ncbi:MAG: FHA domain-containing protein, partial [Acidobacteriota bacterium]
MPRLRVEQREQQPRDLVLRGHGVTIGRGIGNTLHLRDPWLSREHALVEPTDHGSGWRLIDLGSRNGTYLNGERVHTATLLVAGDVINLGDVCLTYLDDQATGVRLADSSVALDHEGTVMISSDELRFDRFHREQRTADREDLLPILNEVASALVSHFPVDELAEKVLDLVLDAVPAGRAALLLRSLPSTDDAAPGDDAVLEVLANRGYHGEDEVTISRTIARVVIEEKQALLTMDAQSDERFDRAVSIMMQGIRSIICAPLVDNRQEVIGLLYLDDRLATPVFSERALRLVGLIANLAAVKLENCYLLEEQLEKRRMEEQLALGAEIQRRLLPTRD